MKNVISTKELKHRKGEKNDKQRRISGIMQMQYFPRWY